MPATPTCPGPQRRKQQRILLSALAAPLFSSVVTAHQHPFLAQVDVLETVPGQAAEHWTAAYSNDAANSSKSNAPSMSSTALAASSKLFGRFLHITDMHPDGFYKHGSAVSSGCHSNEPHKKKPGGKARAGYWGTGISDCDSPKRLISSTLDWLSTNWQKANGTDGIDYIIWTGDSARHDIDSKHPRTRAEIYEYNRWALAELEKAFPAVPIVPTIGNNDIFPHNIMFPGPNDITREYTSIWGSQVPESEFHVFQKGGYYAKEVLPNELAVFSLNTLYFYDSNKAVDGCKKYSKKTPEKDWDPGSVQLDWLEVQLMQLRTRGLQAQLVGHVPPTAGNYFPRCYSRYTDIVLRYQDTIIGQHFGHMNVDAIFLQEGPGGIIKGKALAHVETAAKGAKCETWKRGGGARPISIAAGPDIVDDIRDEFNTLPGRRRTNLDQYNFFFSAPSIVPTWWPSVRVWTYNVTRESAFKQQARATDAPVLAEEADDEEKEMDHQEEVNEVNGDEKNVPAQACSGSGGACAQRNHRHPRPGKKQKHNKTYHSNPDSPSRTNRFLTPLGYSQWVFDIDRANKAYEKWLRDQKKRRPRRKQHHRKGRWLLAGAEESQWGAEEEVGEDEEGPGSAEYQLEYVTYPASVLWAEFASPNPGSGSKKAGHGYAHIPVPKHLLQVELSRFGVDPSGEFELNAADPPSWSWLWGLGWSERLIRAVDGGSSRRGSKKHGKRKLPKALRHMTDWSAESLTVEDVMNFARRLANDDKLWRRYVRRIFSSSGEEKEA
ncbi:hypothetical protein K437DRAFT_258111 [Tilletiaria anomala UBC 951]|uniref:Calcineurin-like phosphoesterase domain-containing protein n=1 Tax=Tilletiaria anomala (strain ATCC 24038 / CBS 436.72 / UBC 951) TaxID=1037660 RepID=A0A066VKB8_TILAU|nr:uncharacterized protein K437DRAFT_258111 [Tilletiaria anomala UBC 951]KDN41886.1 hypothetical protein K437DRAFT_258111 [Tilletiaria anomala UBC 951]